eukprot:PhM_4_TR12042/c0_g1_i1/m.52729
MNGLNYFDLCRIYVILNFAQFFSFYLLLLERRQDAGRALPNPTDHAGALLEQAIPRVPSAPYVPLYHVGPFKFVPQLAVVVAHPNAGDDRDLAALVSGRRRDLLRSSHEALADTHVLRLFPSVGLVHGHKLPVRVQLADKSALHELRDGVAVDVGVDAQTKVTEQVRAGGILDADVVLGAARGLELVDEERRLVDVQHLVLALALTHVAAADALLFHCVLNLLSQVRSVFPSDDVVGRNVADDAVEPDPVRHVLQDEAQQLDHVAPLLLLPVRHVLTVVEPLLDLCEGHRRRRVHLPLVDLVVLVPLFVEQVRKELHVVLEGRAGQVRHPVRVDLEAAVQQPLDADLGLLRAALSVDLVEDGVVEVLHPELHAGHAVRPEPTDFGWRDVVRARLHRQPNDAALCALVLSDFLSDGLGLALPRLVVRVGGVEERPDEFLGVVLRVEGERAAEDDDLDLVDDVPVVLEGTGAVVELADGVPTVAVATQHAGLAQQVRARDAGLVGAVVAVLRAREPPWAHDHGDDKNTTVRLGALFEEQVF